MVRWSHGCIPSAAACLLLMTDGSRRSPRTQHAGSHTSLVAWLAIVLAAVALLLALLYVINGFTSVTIESLQDASARQINVP